MHKIKLSTGTSLTVSRNVYDRVSDKTMNIETGYIKHGGFRIPVWRELKENGYPYNSDEDRAKSIWDKVVWRNIYTPLMDTKINERRRVLCKRSAIGPNALMLPTVKLIYSRSFLDFIKSKGLTLE